MSTVTAYDAWCTDEQCCPSGGYHEAPMPPCPKCGLSDMEVGPWFFAMADRSRSRLLCTRCEHEWTPRAYNVPVRLDLEYVREKHRANQGDAPSATIMLRGRSSDPDRRAGWYGQDVEAAFISFFGVRLELIEAGVYKVPVILDSRRLLDRIQAGARWRAFAAWFEGRAVEARVSMNAGAWEPRFDKRYENHNAYPPSVFARAPLPPISVDHSWETMTPIATFHPAAILDAQVKWAQPLTRPGL
jgi:hypothetical protein